MRVKKLTQKEVMMMMKIFSIYVSINLNELARIHPCITCQF